MPLVRSLQGRVDTDASLKPSRRTEARGSRCQAQRQGRYLGVRFSLRAGLDSSGHRQGSFFARCNSNWDRFRATSPLSQSFCCVPFLSLSRSRCEHSASQQDARRAALLLRARNQQSARSVFEELDAPADEDYVLDSPPPLRPSPSLPPLGFLLRLILSADRLPSGQELGAAFSS